MGISTNDQPKRKIDSLDESRYLAHVARVGALLGGLLGILLVGVVFIINWLFGLPDGLMQWISRYWWVPIIFLYFMGAAIYVIGYKITLRRMGEEQEK